MNDRSYDVAQLGELESLPGPGSLRWTPVRRRFGLTAFGINAPGTHDVSAWERIFAGYGYAEEGDPERGIEELQAALEAKPAARARVLYDLACLECRVGRNEEALDHLREAVELDPSLAARADDDPDFDPIRDYSAFPPAAARAK